MGCQSCTNRKGCRSEGKSCPRCEKRGIFDWFSSDSIEVSAESVSSIVEVRFKNARKAFYQIPNGLEDLARGEWVIVEDAKPVGSYHMGVVDLVAPWIEKQMEKKQVKPQAQLLRIKKRATDKEVIAFKQLQSKEKEALRVVQGIVRDMELDMKMMDVEYFADGKKAIFYYSAPNRVDFRALVKVLISRFHIRVEMRQIGYREEASRIGGIGICGRELCCSTWLSTFPSVAPEAAATQQLPINMQKLSGQCGRLRCCLNYELEAYVAALKDIPEVKHSLRTKEGKAHLQKIDIFQKLMWFSYAEHSDWYPVPVARVQEILALNTKGITPPLLNKVSSSLTSAE